MTSVSMTAVGRPYADVAGILLAGGRSTRFGSDKLLAVVDGRTLLDRAIEAVATVAGSVVVVAAAGSGGTIAATPGRLDPGVAVVEDPAPYEGPLAGLGVGLRATGATFALVAPADAPWMVPAVLALLVDELRGTDAPAAVLERDGRDERFPFAVRTAVAAKAVELLLAGGERRLRALAETIAAVRIPEVRWRAIDPEALTLRDVDRPEDLDPSGGR